MSVDLTRGRRSVGARRSRSPQAMLDAQWRHQLDRLTDLSIRFHDTPAAETDRLAQLEAGIDAVRRDMRDIEARLDRLAARTDGASG